MSASLHRHYGIKQHLFPDRVDPFASPKNAIRVLLANPTSTARTEATATTSAAYCRGMAAAFPRITLLALGAFLNALDCQSEPLHVRGFRTASGVI
jgi:hypothetical protein